MESANFAILGGQPSALKGEKPTVVPLTMLPLKFWKELSTICPLICGA